MRRHTSRPSRSGRPRSRMTRSGPASATWLMASLPECADEHLVPPGGQPDAQGLEQRRIVVDDQDLGHVGRSDRRRRRASRAGTVKTMRAPLRHVGVDPDEPAVGLDEGLGDGQAEPGPAAAAVLAEHLEDALTLVLGAMPGPSSVDRDLDQRSHRRGPAAPSTRMTLPSGERRSAFSSTLASTWPIRTWSMSSRGRSAGASTATRVRAPQCRRASASASSTSSSKATAVGRSSSAPASMRVMSSRLVTSRARRSDCSSISSSSSARSSGLSRGRRPGAGSTRRS